jgi:hypothetical protein
LVTSKRDVGFLLQNLDDFYGLFKVKPESRFPPPRENTFHLTAHHVIRIIRHWQHLFDWEVNMDGTVVPHGHVMERERHWWAPFRRAVTSKEDQKAVVRLFDRAKYHTHAGAYLAHSWAMETILASILLEQGKLIEKIQGKLKEREQGSGEDA